MTRLGGHVLSSADPTTTSAAKGESLADTVRVIENYADLIVIRHPWEGAARLAAEFASVPVINAGDGSHEHPTQTLCDLYTLRREKGSLKDLNVMICGDLKNGRTVHSLVYALARFGAHMAFRPAKGLELPPHVYRRIENDYHCVPLPKEKIDEYFESNDVDAVYVTPNESHKLSLIPSLNAEMKVQLARSLADFRKIDVCYVTRLQLERIESGEDSEKKNYTVVDTKFLTGKQYKKTQVLHPLPRVDELSTELDEDPRGAYFKQAAYGVPVRMALMATVLGIEAQLVQPSLYEETLFGSEYPVFRHSGHSERYAVYSHADGIRCLNSRCIVQSESEHRFLSPKFWVLDYLPLTLRCFYCEYDITSTVVGKLSSRKYFTDVTELLIRAIKSKVSDWIIFSDELQAERVGFHHAHMKSNGTKPARATG